MRKLLSLMICGLSFLPLFAQSDDFGLDFSLSAEKKLRPGMSFGLEGEARTQDNTGSIERWVVGGNFEYRLFQNNDKSFNLKASAGWKYMWLFNLKKTNPKSDGYNVLDSHWRTRHRTRLSLAASFDPNKRWPFQLKETFQYTHIEKSSTKKEEWRQVYAESNEPELVLDETSTKNYKAKDRSVLRSKLTAQYDIRRCKLDPYAAVDYGCGLNYTANKWKFTAGTDYKLTKQSKLDFFYRYITEDDEDEPNGHLIGVGYQFKF